MGSRVLGRLFSGRAKAVADDPAIPSGPMGARAYAIGDVHGRLDLLEALLDSIRADIARRPPARIFIVLIGDLIDRGPASAGVVERILHGALPGVRTVCLMGNHEEMLLRIVDGEPHLLPDWLTYGGYECAQSYGIDVPRLMGMKPEEGAQVLEQGIPAAHLDFIADFVDSFRFGDYLFVHAGIRPGVALDEQEPQDLRWIREDFLDVEDPHGLVVVHGHTIVESPDDRGNRIAIDTGAYRSGRLTALVIEGVTRRYLQAIEKRA